MSTRKILVGYAVLIGVLAAGVFVAPHWAAATWAAIGLTSAGGIALGVRRHGPARRSPWWLIAVAILAFAAGDTVYALSADSFLPDVFYLSMFPLLAVGLLGLTRASALIRDRSNLLDVLTFVCAVALLSWIFLIAPSIAAPGFSSFERSVLAGYALGDLLVSATMVRLLSAARPTPALILLAVGAAGMLGADVLYGLAVIDGSWQDGGPVESGWLVFYAAWGAAGLHPSMAKLVEPAARSRGQVSTPWLLLLGLSSLIAPALLLFQSMTGQVHDGAVIALSSAVVFALVLSRLADALETHRQAVAREHGLREACAALVSASDAHAVNRAVRTGVARLMPPGSAHRVVFVVNQSGGVPSAAASIWGASVPLPAGPGLFRATAAARRTRLLRMRTLQPVLADQLGDFEFAVLCPLVLADEPARRRPRPDVERSAGQPRDEGPGSGPRVGALLVSGDVVALTALRDALEVLAGQAALALERISLSEEINRRHSEEYFRTLVQNTADVILIVDDDDDRIRYASPSVSDVLGLEPAACTTLAAIVHPDDRPRMSGALKRVRAAAEPHRWEDWTARHADGSSIQVEVSCRDLRRDRTVRGLVITLRDVTERRRLERELTHRAFHDALTGLANRVLFHERVHHAVAGSRRTGRTAGVLFIDLDDFKVVNDTMGHTAGDALLVAVGERLAATLGSAATAARLGGDEFAALVEDVPGPADVEQVAERLVAVFAEPFRVGESIVNGAVSIGVATTAEASDGDDLLRHADLALYVAKGAGKGRWRRYQAALHTAVMRRLELRAALDQADADLDFSLEYQPIVALATGRTTGLEALLRWRHPTLGLLGPDRFIEVAEETGLIEPIGDWVLRQALAAAVQWAATAPAGGAPYVSVNVSARQFRAAGFVEKVRGALAASDLPPDRVVLELTESLLLRDHEQVCADLMTLRELGVRMAIDDFGTGFSSLSYLRQLPIDILKIDRSFTADISSSSRQRALVFGIIRLAQTLGLDVVAEGIETPADRDLLGELGCGYGQGFLFSRPMAVEETTTWLRRAPVVVPVQRNTARAVIQ
ncbi:EAL domain-containing protein [Micromonospora sp. NPDC049679]|uniref:putative bifunctional diguanylate cyclase/phosphodiesterase n=1 Tax=Micromonospora sp. NPDC049679 TaxID=3155920 RepID=UPI0033F0CB72